MSRPLTTLPGITGTLFPGRYLSDRLLVDAYKLGHEPPDVRRQAQLCRWWMGATETCGPASGMRALFDIVAMPLFGMLGFRARDARFDRSHARAVLTTRLGTSVALIVLPWATRPSLVWRDLVVTADSRDASWCFLLAPPFLSLVDARGYATRRGVDMTIPDAIGQASLPLFWALASARTFDLVRTPAESATSRIDALVARARQYQDRVREDLREGVSVALRALETAIDARERALAADEALTLVYRLLFLLFAESRELVPVHDPVYGPGYTISALCRDALKGVEQTGLWAALAAITRLSRTGCHTRDLIVAPFNGRLFARVAAPSLERRSTTRSRRNADRKDAAIHAALVALGSRRESGGRGSISYRDLGVEELGAVYEHVLDLTPNPVVGPAPDEPHRGAGRTAPGRHSDRRKETGTFYTPRPLAEFVVRRTLGPLVANRSADQILDLRVVDPAMGSGAFLVAACRYLSNAYERALVDEGRVSPGDLDDDERARIRRTVATRCLSGVDRNPVAVQLARLSLWLATLARGKPLGFLDHCLRTGNSLVGATPDDLRRMHGRRAGRSTPSLPFDELNDFQHAVSRTIGPLKHLSQREDDSISDVREKERVWNGLTSGMSPLHRWRTAADVWCARWFWPAGESGIPSDAELRAIVDALLRNDPTLPAARLSLRLQEVARAAETQRFFHWTLEFADAFYDDSGQPRERPGFDAVIGNPPWEMVRRDARESRADGRPRDLIEFVRQSGGYPSCDRGHLNLYQPFVERSLSLVRRGGRVGLVLPWGLAADDGAAAVRRRLVGQTRLDTLVGLDNGHGLFPIHRGLRFLALVASPGESTTEIRGRFGIKDAAELDTLPGRDRESGPTSYPVRMTPNDLVAMTGSSIRFPDARRPADLALVRRLVDRFPPLGSASGWAVQFGRELNATESRSSFGGDGLPVVEGKHLEPYRVNRADVTARIDRREAARLLPDRRFERPRLGYRDVSGVANRLSLISAIVPAGVVTTHTVLCLRSPLAPDAQHLLCALFNSYVLNAVVRLFMGGHLTTSLVEGLPVPRITGSPMERRIARLAERVATSDRSIWRRALLQAEVARLYEIEPDEFRRLLEGFPLVPRDERERAARFLDRPAHRDRAATSS